MMVKRYHLIYIVDSTPNRRESMKRNKYLK